MHCSIAHEHVCRITSSLMLFCAHCLRKAALQRRVTAVVLVMVLQDIFLQEMIKNIFKF